MSDKSLREALLPCPFCGGKAELRQQPHDSMDTEYFYVCLSCAAEGPWFKTPGNALTSWNRRALPAGVPASAVRAVPIWENPGSGGGRVGLYEPTCNTCRFEHGEPKIDAEHATLCTTHAQRYINDLEIALRSQIDICNTERADKEQCQKRLAALLSEAQEPLSRPLSGTEEMAARLGWIEGYVTKAVADGEGGGYAHKQAMEAVKHRFREPPAIPKPASEGEPRLCEDCGKDTIGRDDPYGCCADGCHARVFLCLDCFYGSHADGHVLCKEHRGPVVPLTEREEKA